MNMVEARVEAATTGSRSNSGLPAHGRPGGRRGPARAPAYAGRTVILGVRPEAMEDVSIARDAPPGRRPRGGAGSSGQAPCSDLLVHFGLDAAPVLTEDIKELAAEMVLDVLEELRLLVAERCGLGWPWVSPRSSARAERAADACGLTEQDAGQARHKHNLAAAAAAAVVVVVVVVAASPPRRRRRRRRLARVCVCGLLLSPPPPPS